MSFILRVKSLRVLWALLFHFGIARQLSYVEELEVCETKNPTDYKMISEWIDKSRGAQPL